MCTNVRVELLENRFSVLLYMTCSTQNKACPIPNSNHNFFAGFAQPSGILQPNEYKNPPPQRLYSRVGGYQPTFLPPKHLQQGIIHDLHSFPVRSSTMKCCVAKWREPNANMHNFTITSAELTPPSGMMLSSGYQTPPPQHLYSGGGGHWPTFTPTNFYASRQGIAQYDFYPFLSSFHQMKPHEKL